MNRGATGSGGNAIECIHIRDLVRRVQDEQAKQAKEEGFATSSKEAWRPGPAFVAPGRTGRDCRRSLASSSIETGGSAPTQALRDQQGEVRYRRQKGDTRVAVKVANASGPANADPKL